ncbi:MAG: HAD family hydrolase [Chloroflexota bacterium]|nr:HAD family hydrolase [Chloroflexota bacterium]
MARPVFLDVDNTLLNNDAAKGELASRIAGAVSDRVAARFWDLYERVRDEQDYVDFPATVTRLRAEHPADAARIERILDELPFRDFVYPGARETIARLWDTTTPVILSDGDPVFQRRKIERAGLAAAVRGNVLIYVHKERRLADVARRFPGPGPVFVDDKARILGHVERQLPDAVTVHVRQGSYASEPPDAGDPQPDVVIDHIAELVPAIARI